MLVGLLSALFFSSTFILNRAISLSGGHWFWTASLRYLWMAGLLVGWLIVSGKGALLVGTLRLFFRHWVFWCLTGGIGFGVFYSLISFSATFAPGWVVATTWQMTILATPAVLLLFGKKVPLRAIAYTLVIFAGIIAVNLGQANQVTVRELLLGGVPVLIAAIAYPLGNQMLWEAQRQGNRLLPAVRNELLDNPFIRILLLTLGTAPFWIILYLCVQPPAPSPGQWVSTFQVAIFSGVIATTLFLQARHLAENSYQLAAVDSLQSCEVLFSLLGELILLGGALPTITSGIGIILTLAGLTLYIKAQSVAQ